MTRKSRSKLSRTGGAGMAVLLALVFAGCSQVPLSQQRLVSKSAMGFDNSAQGHPNVNLMSQVEPGTAASGGAQAAGCTSCR